ncbi:MAG: PIN domain nuclease [Candidatus Cloacimonetes bacterium]|nr:PIN domain nuclease [Candidatus Cloacimonadota bacterium]
MKKIKLYLDTSVISALDDPEKPERMQETQVLWEDIKSGKYDIFVSDVLFEEIRDCQQLKRDSLFNFLYEIEFVNIESSETINTIADEIIKQDILKAKHRNDCLHIGSALEGYCDCIVSWNFRHLVNFKTIKGVRIITNVLNYKNIEIMSPTMLINKEK